MAATVWHCTHPSCVVPGANCMYALRATHHLTSAATMALYICIDRRDATTRFYCGTTGVQVTGFKPAPNVSSKTAVWSAPMPHGAAVSRQMWVNGARAVRAHGNPAGCSGGPVEKRLPCPAVIDSGAATITATGYANVKMDARMNPHVVGAELVYGRGASGASWTEPRCTIAAVSAGAQPGTLNLTMVEPCWQVVSKGFQDTGLATLPS